VEETWVKVDSYITKQIVHSDEGLTRALEAASSAGLPPISVSAPQGKLLHLLVRLSGASRVLEIGTLGGYSAIWMARALPSGGRIVTLELDPHHAEVARSNLQGAGVSHLVDIRVGPALETLPTLQSEGAGPFDLVFIDADKAAIPDYMEWSVKLGRPGTAIVVDNVVRNGSLIDSASEDPAVAGVRRLHEMLASDRRFEATTIQTVGSKGYDGFTLAVLTGS
jgi:predicted O-methyltransferase YrrM